MKINNTPFLGLVLFASGIEAFNCEVLEKTKRSIFTISSENIHSTQNYDNSSNLAFPWFTKDFLDVLTTWNMQDWDVFEWGSGFSTVWFANRCKSIVSIENEDDWGVAVQNYLDREGLYNATVKIRDNGKDYNLNDGGNGSPYVLAIHEDDKLYDCIIIDGNSRNECGFEILNHIKPGGIVILDNANHSAIGIESWPLFKFLNNYTSQHHSYGLKDSVIDENDGFFWHNYTWKTDYWIIKQDHEPANCGLIELYKELSKANLPSIRNPNYIVNNLTRVTPLMCAAHLNNINLAKALLKMGADPLKKDINGSIALNYAESQNNYEIIQLIKDYTNTRSQAG